MESQDFDKFITDIYSRGALMIAISIGHDLGLFEVLSNTERPLSLLDIAEKRSLKERYTKEWLSAMVAAGIIHQDRQTNLYSVPEGHKEVLKLRSSFAPGIGVWAPRAELTKKCFHKNGPWGFGYDEDPGWFDWFNNYRSCMADHTLETELITRLKDQGVVAKLETGIKVLDIGCGVGSFSIGLAKRFPMSHFTGLEYSEKGLKIGRENAKKDNVNNVSFIHGDAHDLHDSWSGKFDLVFVYDVLHDLPNPQKALEEIYKVLKDDGGLSLVEIGFHSNPSDNAGDMTAAMYYSLSMLVCLPSSLSEESREGYGACWGKEEIEKALVKAKFKLQGKSSMIVAGTKAFFYCTK